MVNMVYDQCSDSDDDHEILYGSTPGVELLKDNRSNTKEIKNLKKDVAGFKKDFTDLKEMEELTQEKNAQNEHITSQSKDIEALKEASFGFEAVRHRWINNFRRDELVFATLLPTGLHPRPGKWRRMSLLMRDFGI